MARATLGALGAGGTIEPVVLDVVDADAVHAFAERIATVHDHVDVLVHAAGALFPSYRSAPDGFELTVATAVLAPFRLTGLLGPLLRRSGDADIVTVSSGGMYTERFDLGRLEMSPHAYRGTTAYARANGPRSCSPTNGPDAGVRTEWRAMPFTRAGWTRRAWPAAYPPSPNSVRSCELRLKERTR